MLYPHIGQLIETCLSHFTPSSCLHLSKVRYQVSQTSLLIPALFQNEWDVGPVWGANMLNFTILDINFNHWNSWESSFWKHLRSLTQSAYSLSPSLPPPKYLAEREMLWLHHPLFSSSLCPDGFGFLRNSRCGRWIGWWRDAVKVRGKRKQSKEQDWMVGLESVTLLIACWWLRVVVRSPWFMNSQWTPVGSKVGRRGRSQPQQDLIFSAEQRS